MRVSRCLKVPLSKDRVEPMGRSPLESANPCLIKGFNPMRQIETILSVLHHLGGHGLSHALTRA